MSIRDAMKRKGFTPLAADRYAGVGFKIYLRAPEFCPCCGRVFLSLYPLRTCTDHEGLEVVDAKLSK